ncbi:uncharacterized protein XB5735880.S [Xenopus laevis]|uniref:Uncharacterized protein n=2 Tax=Xenopus laevis TaxID=8355 RepID=A0A974D1N5_XENLA|nr:uncharacterized protein XB5735880.S [Xenopus laevis]OCT82662.1 hypothetical protein XELAEV_18025192mg [Xenopus laevis]
MGRGVAVVLGVLCFFLGSRVTGEIYNTEQVTIQSPKPVTTSPGILGTVPTSTEDFKAVQDETWRPSLSGHTDTTIQPLSQETISVTEQHVSLADIIFPNKMPEAENSAANGNISESFTVHANPAFDPSRTLFAQDSMEREVTSAYPTQSELVSQSTVSTSTLEITDAEDSLTRRNSLTSSHGLPAIMSQDSTPHSTDTTQVPHTITASLTSWMAAITTSISIITTSNPSNPARTSSLPTHTTRVEVQKGPAVLNVGDGEKDVPSYYSKNNSNPLFVMIVSIFTIMVVTVAVMVGFQRYRRNNRRTEFRRLQDLPMEDMMEDTPLSLYSY